MIWHSWSPLALLGTNYQNKSGVSTGLSVAQGDPHHVLVAVDQGGDEEAQQQIGQCQHQVVLIAGAEHKQGDQQ